MALGSPEGGKSRSETWDLSPALGSGLGSAALPDTSPNWGSPREKSLVEGSDAQSSSIPRQAVLGDAIQPSAIRWQLNSNYSFPAMSLKFPEAPSPASLRHRLFPRQNIIFNYFFPSLRTSGGHKGFFLPEIFSPVVLITLSRSCLSHGSLLCLTPPALYAFEKGFTSTSARPCFHAPKRRDFCLK